MGRYVYKKSENIRQYTLDRVKTVNTRGTFINLMKPRSIKLWIYNCDESTEEVVADLRLACQEGGAHN